MANANVQKYQNPYLKGKFSWKHNSCSEGLKKIKSFLYKIKQVCLSLNQKNEYSLFRFRVVLLFLILIGIFRA